MPDEPICTAQDVFPDLFQAYLRGELDQRPPCPFCNDTRVYQIADVGARSYSFFDPCPFCDPHSPRNRLPLLEWQLHEALNLLSEAAGSFSIGATRPGLHADIQAFLARVEAGTPPPRED